MQEPLTPVSAERKAFQTTFRDGLWDILIGCFLLEFALAPLLSTSMGDFWTSVIFLPFWGLVYLAIRLTRKHVIEPRLGMVQFGKFRQKRIRRLTIVLLIINSAALLLGLAAAMTYNRLPTALPSLIGGLLAIVGFSAAGYFLDYPRLYIYGLMLLAAPPIGEWLFTHRMAAHHGFPVVFGTASGIIILVGVITFVRLLRNTAKIKLPDGV